MMVFNETTQVQPRMKLAIGLIILAAAIGVAGLWVAGAASAWGTVGAMVGAALGLVAAVLVVGVWWRNRQRRQLTAMRDSALW